MTDLRAFGAETLSSEIGEDGAKELELNIFRYAINESKCDLNYPTWDHVVVQSRYKEKLKMLLENLGNTKANLKERLLRNEIQIADVCGLSHEDLRPDVWLFHVETPASQQEDSNDSQLKCNNCQRRGFPCYNTEYREFQTRAGDESTTIYAFCRTCLKRWKFS